MRRTVHTTVASRPVRPRVAAWVTGRQFALELGLGMGSGRAAVRLLRLLAAPRRPRALGVLGGARGAPPEPSFQPVHGAAAGKHGAGARLVFLPADGAARRAAGAVHRRRAGRVDLSVLDP